MSDAGSLLDRQAIEEAFRQLGDRWLDAASLPISTSSAVPRWRWPTMPDEPPVTSMRCSNRMGIVLEEARIVASELGLPAWWLNEQASAYVATGGDPAAPRVFDHPGLRVAAASPEHLLAMKVLAARRRDGGDIRFLIRRLGLASVDQVLALCADVFPDEPVPDRARLIVEEAFDADAHQTDALE